ncbi:MAG: hypothetical protein ACM3XS_09100 [Bacteroidota bacterium]
MTAPSTGVMDLLAALSVVSLGLERIVEFVVARAFPPRSGAFLGPGTESRRLAAFGLATLLGMLVISQTSFGLLGRLDPRAGRWFDVIFTGLLLAAGTQPIHSLMRLLELKSNGRAAYRRP